MAAFFQYASPERDIRTRGLFVLGGFQVDAYNAILSELWYLKGALCREGKLVGPENAIVKVDIIAIPELRAVVGGGRTLLPSVSIVALAVFHL